MSKHDMEEFQKLCDSDKNTELNDCWDEIRMNRLQMERATNPLYDTDYDIDYYKDMVADTQINIAKDQCYDDLPF